MGIVRNTLCHLTTGQLTSRSKPFVPGTTLEIVCHLVKIGNKRKDASASANIHVGQGEAFPSQKMDGEKEVSEQQKTHLLPGKEWAD